MDPTSLITALMGAQTGMMQLAVAARLERMNADQGVSVAKLTTPRNRASIRSPMSQPVSERI